MTPISNSTPMSVAGPMQCKMVGKTKDERAFEKRYKKIAKARKNAYFDAPDSNVNEEVACEIEADKEYNSAYKDLLDDFKGKLDSDFIELVKLKYI